MDKILIGSASLVDCIDKKLLVILRDGRKLNGILRSYDQFANLVLQDTVERTFVDDAYSEKDRGVFVVRGENVVLLGEVDTHKDEANLAKLSLKPDLDPIAKQEQAERKRKQLRRLTAMRDRGFSVDQIADDSY